MRVIVYGVGAIGGTVAGALAHSGQDVIGIARGAQLAAIRAQGLTVRAPGQSFVAQFPCVSHPSEIDFREDDVVCLTMKSQDTEGALRALKANAPPELHVFCLQNGIANERMALRHFPNTHGVTVMMPTAYTRAGEVAVFVEPRFGIFDIGRYPSGSDAMDRTFSAAMDAANIAGFATDTVMESKYGKLLMNLGNIIEAALGRGAERGEISRRIRTEAEAVLKHAGISWRDVGASDPRRDALMRFGDVDGVERLGGSTTQSLLRGAQSLETDYLNGEIALIARLSGTKAPLNEALTDLARRLIRDGAAPGSLTLSELETVLAV